MLWKSKLYVVTGKGEGGCLTFGWSDDFFVLSSRRGNWLPVEGSWADSWRGPWHEELTSSTIKHVSKLCWQCMLLLHRCLQMTTTGLPSSVQHHDTLSAKTIHVSCSRIHNWQTLRVINGCYISLLSLGVITRKSITLTQSGKLSGRISISDGIKDILFQNAFQFIKRNCEQAIQSISICPLATYFLFASHINIFVTIKEPHAVSLLF